MSGYRRDAGVPGGKRSHPEGNPWPSSSSKRSRPDPSASYYHWEQLKNSLDARYFLTLISLYFVEVVVYARPPALCMEHESDE